MPFFFPMPLFTPLNITVDDGWIVAITADALTNSANSVSRLIS